MVWFWLSTEFLLNGGAHGRSMRLVLARRESQLNGFGRIETLSKPVQRNIHRLRFMYCSPSDSVSFRVSRSSALRNALRFGCCVKALSQNCHTVLASSGQIERPATWLSFLICVAPATERPASARCLKTSSLTWRRLLSSCTVPHRSTKSPVIWESVSHRLTARCAI